MADTLNKTPSSQSEPTMKGWLFKWTNYIKGYQRRWFVLQNGQLLYYRAETRIGSIPRLHVRNKRHRFRPGNQAEMAHTCRGSISLHGALIYPVDSCTFVISNGGTQTFHIRAASEVERQSWVTALELAKAKAIRSIESEEEEEAAAAVEADGVMMSGGDISGSGGVDESARVIQKLEAQLNDLQTCSDLINKHWKALVKPLNEIESNTDHLDVILSKSKEIGERATLFRISTNAMINACGEYMKTVQTHGHKWIRLLQHERKQKQQLQEMVETLAQQHSNLEHAATMHTQRPPGVSISEGDDEEDEIEFYDAVAESGTPSPPNLQQIDTQPIAGANTSLNHPPSTITIHSNNSTDDSSSEDDDENLGKESEGRKIKSGNELGTKSKLGGKKKEESGKMQPHSSQKTVESVGGIVHRRTRVPDKPNYPLNLWSIMKNCIGKDLSKIPMPVNFSEPLSMLQRLTEDYEYASILDVAAKCTSDPCEQLAYVAAFTISAYSTTSSRTGKPFNPLLGETYECDRSNDLGWRAISEQVSHHPPMVAQYCESTKKDGGGGGWRCWQEFTMTSKFRGKYLQVIPLGTAQVEFVDSGNKYSWRKVTTTIHNIIVGKLWVDQHGDMEIVGKGAAAGIKCHLKFIPYSYFTRDTQRRVKGVVMDANGSVKWLINGTWDDQVEISPVNGRNQSSSSYQTGEPILAWKRHRPPVDSDRFYNFTVLAAQLNEPEPLVAPTDTRLRPDQRLMEDGHWDEANAEKVRLEEKQRAARRAREAEAETAVAEGQPFMHYKPLWFEQMKDEDSDTVVHVYKGCYWEAKEKQDWGQCPDIF